MKRLVVLMVVGALISLGPFMIHASVCSDQRPAPDVIGFECCATYRLCIVPDAGLTYQLFSDYAVTIRDYPCNACVGWCYASGGNYVAHYSVTCNPPT